MTQPAPATLSYCCGACGAAQIVPCPTIADIGAATIALMEHGWGFDARGRCRCPGCLAFPKSEPPPAPGVLSQGVLFFGAPA